MLQSFRKIFFELSPWIILFPTLLALRLVWKKKAHDLIPLLGYLLLALATQVASFILWRNSVNNLPLLHLYTLLEFIFLFGFYMVLLGKKMSAPLPAVTFLLLAAFLVVDSLILESLREFNNLGRSVEAFVFILLSLAWFLKIAMKEFRTSNLDALKFIVAGLFIYFSGSIILFSFSGLTTKLTDQFALGVWSIHTLLLVLLYISLTLGLLKWKTN